MTLLEPVERYFDAWNSHDGDAIAACFDPDGGYTDPVSGRLAPPGITAYASGLFDAFPIYASNSTSQLLMDHASSRSGP
jgi:hypothetical protein